MPDLTLYLDVDEETGLQRARGRGELDRIEEEDIEFFRRTRTRYLELAKRDPNIVIINAKPRNVKRSPSHIKSARGAFVLMSFPG